jgi:hypothetical protein
MEKAKLDELKAKYPESRFLALPMGVNATRVEVFLKAPSREDFKRWRLEVNSGPQRGSMANENLVRATIVDPGPEAANALFEKWPGLTESLVDTVMELAGVGVKAEVLG